MIGQRKSMSSVGGMLIPTFWLHRERALAMRTHVEEMSEVVLQSLESDLDYSRFKEYTLSWLRSCQCAKRTNEDIDALGAVRLSRHT